MILDIGRNSNSSSFICERTVCSVTLSLCLMLLLLGYSFYNTGYENDKRKVRQSNRKCTLITSFYQFGVWNN